MKKLLILAAILLTVTLSSCSKVEMTNSQITAVFQYGNTQITKTLSEEDAEIIREIFKDKTTFIDSPSCGFSENIALVTDETVYCIACDGCGKVYDKNNDKYFNLIDGENETLQKILRNYGFEFPCN